MFVALVAIEALSSVPWWVNTTLSADFNGRRHLEQGRDEKPAD